MHLNCHGILIIAFNLIIRDLPYTKSNQLISLVSYIDLSFIWKNEDHWFRKSKFGEIIADNLYQPIPYFIQKYPPFISIYPFYAWSTYKHMLNRTAYRDSNSSFSAWYFLFNFDLLETVSLSLKKVYWISTFILVFSVHWATKRVIL